ncbi:MAG: hypothetical protein ABJH68_09405 [Ilumatobacter sp.]|uniref:hypothetical protein n=1 Tax=Ilumatobacter sp. TaxID=1967498 RepID=UPI00329A6B0E
MNVFDEIQGSRPGVEPMPMGKRREIRESLFGIGHGDTTRNITGRSESGAVVSTAPHGMRRPIAKRRRPAGSLAKLGAGLLVFAVLGAVVWSYSTRDETVAGTETTTTTSTTTSTTTIAPVTTSAALVRTGVTADTPLALPTSSLPFVEATVRPAIAGSSALVLGAPDGTEVWMAEFDGEPADPSGLDIRQVGSLGVGVDSNRAEGALASYRPQVPCGVVIVNDAIGRPLDRQPMVDLFSAMSIDGDATIDVTLPVDWSVFSLGDSRTIYSVRFDVPGGGEGAPASALLVQTPGGSFAELMFGGRQLDPVTFLDGPAFIEIDSPDPTLVSVFWQDSTTVFNLSSNTATLADLEAFAASLTPVGLDEWTARFGAADPVPAAVAPPCSPQPSFGTTFEL